MYLLLLVAFTAIFLTSYILTKLFFNNRVSALLLLISGLLYLLPTIAGAWGILRPQVLFTFSFVALLLSVLTYLFSYKDYDKFKRLKNISLRYCAKQITFEVLTVAIPVSCALSWISIFVVQSIRHRIANHYIPPLPWDVVEYHFYNLVGAIQNGSLWTALDSINRSPWAHYPMGCEMFHSWGFVFLRNDALLPIMHFFFSIVLILFSCLTLHVLCFQERKTSSGVEVIADLIIAIMLLLFPPLWDMEFNSIGKNDIAMSAFIIVAFYYILECINNTSASETYRQNILLMGIALGMICGIKPHGVLYSAFFLGMLLRNGSPKKFAWYSVGVVSLCIVLLAGFWYFRILITLKTIPPSGLHDSIIFNLNRGLNLFFSGRENILFTLSAGFCLVMAVVWHNQDLRMRAANYTLAASLVIFCLTPFSAWHGSMELRLAPATIPLAIIIGVATFLRLMIKTGAEDKACYSIYQNYWTYRRGVIFACASLGLGLGTIMAISLAGGLGNKPRWGWNLQGLAIIGFLAASIYIYHSMKALKDYQLSISRSLLAVISFFIVVIMLVTQIVSYKPFGDLPGYNQNTSAYRWVYQNIRGKTICLLGLRPYGLYGKEFSNRVIYGGTSYGTKLESWLSCIREEKADYLVIGRDYHQLAGAYDFRPFPSDLAKIQAMPDIFKSVWSDNGAVVFRIEPGFFSSGRPSRHQ
jgi:hypothetical protein